jgi:hypothetical protein
VGNDPGRGLIPAAGCRTSGALVRIQGTKVPLVPAAAGRGMPVNSSSSGRSHGSLPFTTKECPDLCPVFRETVPGIGKGCGKELSDTVVICVFRADG